MAPDECITFKQVRDGTWTPATPQDSNACKQLGLRLMFGSEAAARKACERAGAVFLRTDMPEPKHPIITPAVEAPCLNTPADDGTEDDGVDGQAAAARKARSAINAKHPTREQWLHAAVDAMRPWFNDAGTPLKDKIRVSCGWPRLGRKFVGEAWHSSASADGTREVFISPAIAKADTKAGVLAILTHELVHCALPAGTGHKREFQKLAGAVGLVSPWKATIAGPELVARIEKLAVKLGAYPHAAMSPVDRHKKQTTRLIKCACKTCGYTVRTTGKWLEIGAPRCTIASHGEMKVSTK